MFSRFSPALFPILFLFIIGCSASRSTLATVGDEHVPLREYENMFAKNNGGWEKAKTAPEDDLRRFLDLFIKYKLKLLEAKNKGLLQDTAVQNELQTYRSSIASSYTLGKELIEPRLKQMHQRQLEEKMKKSLPILLIFALLGVACARTPVEEVPPVTLAGLTETAERVGRLMVNVADRDPL